MACTQLKKLLAIEEKELREEIERDKWFQSEKAGHDIGWREAEQHYINHHLKGWAAGFKDCYCSQVCKEENCGYRK